MIWKNVKIKTSWTANSLPSKYGTHPRETSTGSHGESAPSLLRSGCMRDRRRTQSHRAFFLRFAQKASPRQGLQRAKSPAWTPASSTRGTQNPSTSTSAPISSRGTACTDGNQWILQADGGNSRSIFLSLGSAKQAGPRCSVTTWPSWSRLAPEVPLRGPRARGCIFPASVSWPYPPTCARGPSTSSACLPLW